MAREEEGSGKTVAKKGETADLRVEGRAALEGGQYPSDIQLRAYVFDRAGQTLGAADIGKDGAFSVALNADRAGDV